MSLGSLIFKRYTPNFEKIEEYGFFKQNEEYIYKKIFMDGDFEVRIKILKSGNISTAVYDTENNEEYLPLKVKVHEGTFVGKIREEYEKILTDICNKCFIKNLFIFRQSNRISNYIYEKYGNKPEFLWEKYSGFAVFRNSSNKKWYGLISNINGSKLDESKKEEIEIINLKLNEDKIQNLLKVKGFYPAWHMNKKTWISVILDETLSDEIIFDLINESYKYTLSAK